MNYEVDQVIQFKNGEYLILDVILYKLGFSIYKVEKNGFKKNNIFYDLAYTCLENVK